MKSKTHPQYHDDCQVTCACGNSFTTGSTLPKIKVEICAACHPFFTGQQKFIDTLGRVERFKQKQAKADKIKSSQKSKKKEEKKKKQKRAKTLKEMLKVKK